MARNLVKEAEEAAENQIIEKIKTAQEESKPEEKENVIVITTEQVILNNLDYITKQLEELKNKIEIGFKQVGVTF